MSNPKISVIIPFYNVEKYIERCIQSVKNQTWSDFECLLIDDESPDNSYQIALDCIHEDPRFSIIQQKNKGLGGARNTGIEHAKGEYIAFLDSDDWWDNKFLEIMYSEAILTDADVVTCQYQEIYEDGKYGNISSNFTYKTTDKIYLRNYFLKYPTAWNKLYKKIIFNNIRYPEKIYYEDLATTYKIVDFGNKFTFVSNILIFYTIRNGSIMNGYSIKHITDYIEIFNSINQYLKTEYFSAADIIYYIHSIIMHTVKGNADIYHRILDIRECIYGNYSFRDIKKQFKRENIISILYFFPACFLFSLLCLKKNISKLTCWFGSYGK